MGYVVPALLYAAILVLEYYGATRRALGSKDSAAFFAEQVWIFLGVTFGGIAFIVLLWLQGRWSLRFPAISFALYSLAGVVWFTLGAWAWTRKPAPVMDTTETQGGRIGSWTLLVLGGILLALLSMFVGTVSLNTPEPLETGQITASLSYEVHAGGHGLWFGRDAFSYEVYRTPRWFAAMHQEVAGATLAGDGPDRCVLDGGSSYEYRTGSVRFRLGKDNHTLLVTCTNQRATGPQSNTVEVSMP